MNDARDGRLIYDMAQLALRAGGVSDEDIQKAVLAQSYLRMEQPLTTGTTLIKFPVLINDNQNGQSARPTEQRLKLQDAFYCSDVAVYIAKAASATDTTFVPVGYPNPVTFATGAAPLGTFYNGKLNLIVNNRVLIPGMDILRFKQAPATQITTATNPWVDEFDGINDRSSFIALQPMIVLIGQKNIQLQIELPAALSAIDANSYAIIVFRGILAQNVTVVS